MKTRLIIIALVALTGIVGFVVANPDECRGAQCAESASVISNKSLVDSTIVYDVRTSAEYAVSHVADATLLPLSEIQAGNLPATAKDTPIAVYCRSGNRSSEAAALLSRAGYTDVTDMGGLDDISQYGLDLTS